VYVGSSCTLESSLATRKENKKYIAHKDTHNFAFVPSGGRGIIEKHYTHNIITKKRGRQKEKKNRVEETTFFFHPNRLYKCIYICIYI
jgi:hypothetical protein